MFGRRFSTPPARDAVTSKVLAALERHPIAEAAVREAFAARQAERRHHAAEIERLTSEQANALAAAQSETDAAEREVQTAHHALQAAQERANRATDARVRLSLSSPHTIAIARHRAELAEAAEPEISSFIDEMNGLLAADRSKHVIASTTKHNINPFSLGRRMVTRSNIESLRRRMEAIHEAIRQASALKAEPDQSRLALTLAALRAGIPTVREEVIKWTRPPREAPKDDPRHNIRSPKWAEEPELERTEFDMDVVA